MNSEELVVWRAIGLRGETIDDFLFYADETEEQVINYLCETYERDSFTVEYIGPYYYDDH